MGLVCLAVGVTAVVVGLIPASAEEPVDGRVPVEDPSEEPTTTSTSPTASTSTTELPADIVVDPGPEPDVEPDPAAPAPPPEVPVIEEPVDALSLEASDLPAEAPPAQKGVSPRASVSTAAVGDIDNDGILDGGDNCPSTFNVLQGDHDGDLLGNACDPNFGEQDGVAGNIYENRLCQAITLAPNDDSSSQESQKIFFPTPLSFFGVEQRWGYVNNNGNLTFVNPLATFTPFAITAVTPPIIAPFLGDVDTRPVGGGKVSYGVALRSAAFGGRNVTCVTWEHVGYFSNHSDKRNTFQLLIVERSDIAPGDFDIYFKLRRRPVGDG